MTPAQHQQIGRLFHAAMELEPDQRAAFLAQACDGDESLRIEVESLLASHEQAAEFIAAPALAVAAKGLAQAPSAGFIGQLIGHYQILSMLGAGGMGEVYLAEDQKLGRKVAIKLLPPRFTQDAERLRRFEQEARAASALNHPNIITIHEIGQVDGTHYLVTEFIDGQTLRQRMRSARLEPMESLDLAVQVGSALAAAHEVGIVHRDIKPENLMLRRDGYVKVLDFGLAKLTAPPAQTVDTQTPTAGGVSTDGGVVMGTAQYMSPEQARGQKVDARSDIFSLGIVLYEMVTGRAPFAGETMSDVIATLLGKEPLPLTQLLPEVPVELERIVAKALRKDREERYQTIKDLLVDLKGLRQELELGAKGVTMSGARPAQMPSYWPLLVAVLLLVLMAGGLFLWRPWGAPQNMEPLRAIGLTTLPGVELYPSFSPDGAQVVFAWTGPKQDNQDIYVQMIGQDSRARLTKDSHNDYNPVWSPDGLWIAFFRGPSPSPSGPRSRELRLVSPLGGPERKLADIRSQDFFPTAAYLAWAPDSKSLIVTDSPGDGQPDALFVVSLETRKKRPLTNPPPAVLADISPAVSPDGRSVIFLRRTFWHAGELHLLPLGEGLTAAGEPRRLTPLELRADYPAWMPDGKEIIFSARGSLWRLAVPGEIAPTRIPGVGEDGLMPTISRPQPGKPPLLVYVRSFADPNIWRIETSTPGALSSFAPAVTAISSTKLEYHCRLSSDGRRVVFNSNRSGEKEIWVSDTDRSNAVQLTFMGAQETMCPHWSPDGQFITFASNQEGEFEIYVISAAGGKPRRLTSHPAIDISPTFSRDGKWIYFASTRSGDYRIWKMPAAGGEAVQVTPNQGSIAFESPDGRNLYYTSFSVMSPLWRMPASGGEPVKVLEGVVWFNFWVLDKGAYYIDQLGSEKRLQYLNFGAGKSTTVAHNIGEVTAGLTASSDGRTILFTRMDSSADDLMMVENFR